MREVLVVFVYGLLLLALMAISFTLPGLWGDGFGFISMVLVAWGTWKWIGLPWRKRHTPSPTERAEASQS